MSVTNTGPVDDDLIGQACGDSYVIVELLGEGGMGAVYLAKSDALAGQQAAVKVLLPELTRKAETLTRFRAEAYAAGKVNDPNIVRIFDTGELPGGRAYILMEYCGGGSLAALIKQRGPLPFDLVLTILSPIASALASAHKVRITHRDLKPENILIDRDGSLMRGKLADFGIAKLHDQVGMLKTGTQRILGSPGYMAPEQCGKKGGVDSRADIYAFGSVLYEAVTGQRPYPGNSLYELIQNVVSDAPFPRPSSLRRDLPPEWEAVIMGCLAHGREDRIQTIKEVIQLLARSIPNGEVLMGFFAHRMVDDKRAPTAITLSDGIGPAPTLWSEAQIKPVRKRASARMALAVAGGMALGSAGTALVLRGGGGTDARRADDVAMGVAPVPVAPGGVRRDAPAHDAMQMAPRGAAPIVGGAGGVAAVASADTVEPARTAIAPAHVAVDAGAQVAGAADAGARVAAVVDAGVAIAVAADAGVRLAVFDASVRPAVTNETGARPPALDAGAGAVIALTPKGSDRPDKPPAEKRTSQAPTGRGTLRVEVEPWADVTITVGGQKATYTTPVAVELAAGRHRILLAKGAQRETVEVTITPHATTRITRTW